MTRNVGEVYELGSCVLLIVGACEKIMTGWKCLVLDDSNDVLNGTVHTWNDDQLNPRGPVAIARRLT